MLLGVIATIVSLQYNETVQATISREFKKAFEEALDCTVQFKLKRVNFFMPCLELEQMSVTSKKGTEWDWHADSFSAGFSWIHLILKRAVELRVIIGTIGARSQYNQGQLAIMGHIERMMKPAGVPISLSELKLEHASFELQDISGKNKAFIAWQNHSKKIPGSFKTIVHILDGSIVIDNTLIVSDYAGTISLELTEDVHNTICPTAHIATHGTLHGPSLPSCALTIKGEWINDHGSFIAKSQDEKTILYKARAHQTDNGIHVESSAQIAAQLIGSVATIATGVKLPALAGTISMQAHNTLSMQGVTGLAQVSINNVSCDNTMLCKKLDATVHVEKQLINGYCNIDIGDNKTVDATIFYNHEQQHGMLGIHTKDALPIASITVPPCTAQCSYNRKDHTIQGAYSVHTTDPGDHPLVHGTYEIDNNTISIHGSHHTATFGATVCTQPFTIRDAHYTQVPTNQQLFHIASSPDDPHSFSCMLDITRAKDFITAPLARTIQADGKLILDARIKDQVVQGTCSLSQGNIRLPQTYNFISGLRIPFSIDFNQRKCTISKAECNLHKGSIVCNQGTVSFNNAYQLDFVHMPILFDSCLLNPTKDLFAIVSGSCLFSYQQNKLPFLQSHVIIERSQLKENLFSPLFQRALFGPSTSTPPHIACDITVQTRDPIRIKTAFLEANAKVAVNMGNTLAAPHLSGSLQIDSGTLSFPYKPLYINKAEIILQPDKLDDPVIELLAKNTIKKHQITLAVSGSLQNHTISLESSPALTEDQIMALLLVGSPNESLNIVMPALVMQNIKNIIFESEQSPLKLDTYFRHMLKPLKHIHLAPSFIDQTARGGVRGGIEIEIGDRWRALIQKNFSLSEDTRFELEYLVSDDVSIRAIRDERRDASAEAEFRWKF